MHETYIEVGTVSDLPLALIHEVEQFARELQQSVHFAKRAPLAGPNDIFDVVMSADIWATMLPWVRDVLGGAASYLGGYAASLVVKSRVERKIDQRLELLEKSIQQSFESQEAVVAASFNQLIDRLNDTRTPFVKCWELRIGLKGGFEDSERAAIVADINPESLVSFPDEPIDVDRSIKKEDVARAILASAVLGPAIETYIDDFREVHDRKARFTGTFFISEDNTIQAEVNVMTSVDHLQFKQWNVLFEQKCDGFTQVSEKISDIPFRRSCPRIQNNLPPASRRSTLAKQQRHE